MTSEESAWLRLHLTRGLGRTGLIRLHEAFGDAETILATPAEEWRVRAGIRPSVAAALPSIETAEKNREMLEQLGVSLIPLWDEDRYPPLLRAIHDPPALLYVRGTLPETQTLAVVGSRKASRVGLALTEQICAELAEYGITIISGLARGIDTAAHRGALAGDGLTVGVLGCGIDQIYPPENKRLFAQVIEQGAVLSEYPPGTQPLPGHFPGRNRVISGLSRGVLVVEAAEGSGSLLTVDFALEQGREVFAVPGSVAAQTSAGVNRLLKEGAHLVTEARDILDQLMPKTPTRARQKQVDALEQSLDGEALALYRSLGEEPLHVDELARKSGLTPMGVSAILLHLELQGGVQQLPGMRFVRGSR